MPLHRHLPTPHRTRAAAVAGWAVCCGLGGLAQAQTTLVERHTAPLRLPAAAQGPAGQVSAGAMAPAQTAQTAQSARAAQAVQVAVASVAAAGTGLGAGLGSGLVSSTGSNLGVGATMGLGAAAWAGNSLAHMARQSPAPVHSVAPLQDHPGTSTAQPADPEAISYVALALGALAALVLVARRRLRH